jgi:SnoaL-like domain
MPCITTTSPCPPSASVPREQIHSTLHTYPVATNTKDFGLLTSISTTSATANCTGYLSNLTGMAAIRTGLASSAANVDTQTLLGTTAISVNNCMSANGTTYF